MTELARTPFSAVWLDTERVAWFDRAPDPTAPSDGEGDDPSEVSNTDRLLSRAGRTSTVEVVVHLRSQDLVERTDLPAERGVGPVMLLGADRYLVALMSTSFAGEPHPIYRVAPGGEVKRIGQVPLPPRAAVVLADAVLVATYDVGQPATLWRVPIGGGHARELGAMAPGLRPSLVVLEGTAYTVVDGKLYQTDGNTPLRPVPGSPQPLSTTVFVADETLVVDGANGLMQWLPGGTSRPLPHRPTFPRAVTATDTGWVWLERTANSSAEADDATDRLKRWSRDGTEADVLRSYEQRVGGAMIHREHLVVSLQSGDTLFAPEYRIELQTLPAERPQSSQVPAEPQESPLADEARQARREALENRFGRLNDELPPPQEISGAWPSGALLQLRGRGRFEGRTITVTSGLSDPDLPRAGVGADLREAPTLKQRAGYGLELAIVTPEQAAWPAAALAALVRAQLRNRFLYLDVLERFGCALETRIPLPDGTTVNLILSSTLDGGPHTLALPNGTADLIYAVVVPDSMLEPIQRAGAQAALTYLSRHGNDPTTER